MTKSEIMNHEEAKSIFTDQSSWTGNEKEFWRIASFYGVTEEEGDWFGLTATRLWDALPESDKDQYAAAYAEYYAA